MVGQAFYFSESMRETNETNGIVPRLDLGVRQWPAQEILLMGQFAIQGRILVGPAAEPSEVV